MKITCESCGAKYAIADDKVVGRKVKVRCKSCSTAIVVDGTQPAAAPYGGAPEEDEATRVVQGPPAFGDEPAGADGWSVNLSDTDQRTMTTEEIVSGWHSGLITEDAFVWRDGMPDWVPVLEMNELYDAISAAAQPSAPPPAAPPPSAPPPPAAAGFGPVSGPGQEAARLSGGRAAGGADLFGSLDSAGSEHDPAYNAPAAEPAQHAYDAKPTGARNENSVLFSLDALKAGFGGPAPGGPGQAPPPPKQPGGKANLDDLMGFGGGGDNPLFGLGANQALLTAPAPEPEPPPPPPPPSVPPPGPGGQVASIPPPPARTNKVLIAVAGGAVLLVLLLGGALALTLGHKKGDKVAENDAKTAASADSKTDQAKDDKTKDDQAKDDKSDQAKDEKKDDTAAADSAKPSESASAEAPPKNATPEEQKRFMEALKKKKAAAAKKKEEAKTEKSPPPEKHEVSASFNKSAAISSLTSAAAAAAGCKRPGGPTGRGRAIVTFAPSGRVTSANVSGGGFGGTTVGGCVASVFRHAHIPAFSGHAVTVAKSFTIPQ